MGLKRATPAAPPLHEVVTRAHERDEAGLLAQLAAGAAEARRWAARDLAAHPEAATMLGARLAGEADASVRETIFTSLGEIGTPAAAAALLPLLRSEDPALRNGAIESLSAMPAAAAPHVDALLHDADPDVRIFAVNLLGELKHPEVPRWLAGVLARDGQVNVVAAAIEVLAEVGSAAERPALDAAARRFAADPFIAFAAEVAAARMEGG